MTRVLAAACACLSLAACAGNPASDARSSAAKTPPAAEMARLEQPGCYTVDLFDPPRFTEPGPDVPETHARYVGVWGGGMWGGEWCHEMVITKVTADGQVELLDMHAPWYDEGAPATVFKRRGRIHEDGSLRFTYGSVQRIYQFVGDKLMAQRNGGKYGSLQAVLSRATL